MRGSDDLADAAASYDWLPVGVVAQAPTGAIISCNRAAERILGLTADQMMGRTSVDPRWRAMTEHGEDLPGDDHPAMVALRSGEPVRDFLMGVHRPSGEQRWIRVSAEPRFVDGSLEGVVSVFTDVTEGRNELAVQTERQKALREVTELSQDLITRHDAEDRCIWASAAARSLLGVRPRDLLDGIGLPLAHPEDTAMIATVHELRARGEQDIAPFEWRALPPDGRVRWIETTGRFRDAESGGTGYVLSHRDITARHQAETAARRAEIRFGAGFEAAPIAKFLISPGGRITLANAAASVLTGRQRDDLVGQPWEVLLDPDDREAAVRQLAGVMGGSGAVSVEHRRFRRPDGSQSVTIHHLTPIHDDDGRLGQVLSHAVDITELHEASEALAASESRLTALLQAAPDAIVVFDEHGAIEIFSRGAEAIFARHTDAAVGAGLEELFADGDAEALIDRIGDYLDGLSEDLLGRFRVTGRTADGRTFPLEINLAEVVDEGRRWFTAICRDTSADDAAIEEIQESERRFRTLADASPVGIFTTDADGSCTYTNPRWQEIYGIGAEDALGAGWTASLHPDDVEAVLAELDAADAEREPFRSSFRLLRRGEVRWVRVVSTPVFGRRGEIAAHIGSVDDVTAERAAAEEVAGAEERFRAIFEQAPLGIAELAEDGTMLRANHSFRSSFALGPRELLPALPDLLDDPEVAAQVADVLAEGGSTVQLEHRKDVDPEPRLLLVTVTSLHHTLANGTRGILQVVDLTERHELEEQLRHLADHDPLTGLRNRRSFGAALEAHLLHAERYGWTGAVALIDLDRFKAVNDRLGHGAGDELLVALARELRSRLRATDVVARLGGDEFAVLVPLGAREQIEGLAASLVKRIEHLATAMLPASVGPVSASIGIHLIDGPATADELLSSADAALYEAKAAGRNRYAIAGRA